MKRSSYFAVAALAILAIVFWAGWANWQTRKQARERVLANHGTLTPVVVGEGQSSSAVSPLLGKPAPGFTLIDVNGKKVSFADYKGKAVLINFWATWCGPCKLEIPWLLDFQNKYAAQGFVVLGISADELDAKDKKHRAEQAGEILKFVKENKMTYPVLLDADSLEGKYGDVDGLPASYYVDRDGKVVAASVGLVAKDEMESNIKKSLGGA